MYQVLKGMARKRVRKGGEQAARKERIGKLKQHRRGKVFTGNRKKKRNIHTSTYSSEKWKVDEKKIRKRSGRAEREERIEKLKQHNRGKCFKAGRKEEAHLFYLISWRCGN